jgi:hypothetical protein
MSQSTLPKTPVPNWEQVRDVWIDAVTRLIGDAEQWSLKQDWSIRRVMKTIQEDRLGSYEVPQLLIQSTAGRLLLDPVACYIAGATGLVDLFLMPSYDSVTITRYDDGGWHLHPDGDADKSLPWSEENFIATAEMLYGSNA